MLQAFAGALPALERCFGGRGSRPRRPTRRISPRPARARATPGGGDDEHLFDGFLGAVPGLRARLGMLARPCWTSAAAAGTRSRWPPGSFPLPGSWAWDIDGQVVASAQARRALVSLGNAAFVIGDAAALPTRPRFDVITAFDAVHDQRVPQEVLHRVRAALAPGGVFVMVDEVLQRPGRQRGPSAGRPVLRDQPAVLHPGRPGWRGSRSAPCGEPRERGRCWPAWPVSATWQCWTRPGRRTASSSAAPDQREPAGKPAPETSPGNSTAQRGETSCAARRGMVICGDG